MADYPEADDQDLAEVFDEDNVAGDSAQVVEPDRTPDLADYTAAEGDEDDDAFDFDDEADKDAALDEEDQPDETDRDPAGDSPRTRLEDRPERGPARSS